MPTAFSYVRFSSDKQKHGASLKRQNDMAGTWLLNHPEYQRSELEFEDLGISGYKGKHLDNAFGRLLAAIENGTIAKGDCVLIEAIDRAGRLAPSVMLNLLTEIVNAGVSLVSLDDGVVYDDNPARSNNLFLLVAKVQQAHQYSDALSRRVKDAYARKRVKAAEGGGATRRTPLWLDADGKLIEDVAPIITRIFQDYADGIGERRILARVRGEHPLLDSLNPTTIKKWLKNPTAVGRWQPRPVDGVEQPAIDDVYPAVVSKELWYRVQKRLASGSRIKSASAVYLMSGLVKCGRCGRNFGVNNTKKSPALMLCMGRQRLGKAGCDNSRSIPMTVLDFIRSRTMQSAMLRAASNQKMTIGERRLIEIDGELSELNKQVERLVDAIAEFGTVPSIRTKMESVKGGIAELEKERAFLTVAPRQETISDMVDIENILMDDDQQKLNAMLQEAGYVIVCDGTTMTVEEENLYDTESGNHQVFEYKGANRATETYRLIENNRIEHHLDMPNSSIVEAQIEEDLRDEAEMQKLVDEGKLTRLVYHVTETGMTLKRAKEFNLSKP
ncbi:recombinase family protein [Pseudomonas helleri]|uniref:recombinase family protein n=1 Tax=Pseudomonas helleri TaxID=1608996 RepID=UPI001295FF89|nr:recombinase family protein [Pseudomonas helleri]MQT34688.1 recombinase family protein [Pseudomonas helleri]